MPSLHPIGHIALVGIEKVIPRERDLSVFLNLLGRSATGQQLTVYTEFISGPKRAGPMNPAVEVATPSMDFARNDVSST